MIGQLIAHAVGDYILQSDWMANNKTKSINACAAHCVAYALPFLFLTLSPTALLVIILTHFLIDHFRLARFVVYAKNFIAPLSVIYPKTILYTDGDPVFSPEDEQKIIKKEKVSSAWIVRMIPEKYRWENCKATGYPSELPPYLAFWLLIFADNTLHLLINFLALKYL